MKSDISINFDRLDPQIAIKLINELEEKGFYLNGSIIYSEEQGKDVRDILDKYLFDE